MKKLKILMVAGAATMLSSCDLSQIPGLDGRLSMEDSKAVGAACRHSGRALEDCFTLNPNTHQAGVFEGWRDMNDYMLANQIDVVKPEIRNSAFRPEQSAVDHGAKQAPGQPGPVQGASPADAVPLAQGRQRWLPQGVEEAAAEPAQPEVGSSTPDSTKADAQPAEKQPAAVQAPAAEQPSRPWERKKDPKKHT